jgi:hypothetical protein
MIQTPKNNACPHSLKKRGSNALEKYVIATDYKETSPRTMLLFRFWLRNMHKSQHFPFLILFDKSPVFSGALFHFIINF